jgi:hypothetical protein
VIDLYQLSLLPLGTFLATWLYTDRKTPDMMMNKPFESGGKLNPPGAEAFDGSELNLISNHLF